MYARMKRYLNYGYILIICCLIIALVSVSTRSDDRPIIVRHSSRVQFNPDSTVLIIMSDQQDIKFRQVMYHSDIHCNSLHKGNVAAISYYDPPAGMTLVPCAYCARIFPVQNTADQSSSLKKLYDQLNVMVPDYDWGSEDDFIKGMHDDQNRQWLYDLLSEKGLFSEQYDYATFCSKLGF